MELERHVEPETVLVRVVADPVRQVEHDDDSRSLVLLDEERVPKEATQVDVGECEGLERWPGRVEQVNLWDLADVVLAGRETRHSDVNWVDNLEDLCPPLDLVLVIVGVAGVDADRAKDEQADGEGERRRGEPGCGQVEFSSGGVCCDDGERVDVTEREGCELGG